MISIPDFGLSVDAEVDIGTPSLSDSEEALQAAWRAWTMPRILVPAWSMPAAAAGGTFAARIGEGPQEMRQWTVKRFVADLGIPVGGVEPAVITGAFLFADTTGVSHTQPGNLPATSLRWRWGNNPLPIVQSWTDEQLTIFGPEDLVFVIVATGAFAALGGQAQVVDEPMYTLDFQTWLNTIKE